MAGLGLVGLWVFLIAVVIAAVVLASVSIRIADRISADSESDGEASSLSPFLTTVALVYGALLGFTVVVAWEQFSSASANVASESSTLATMYRQTVAMPDPERSEMRELLRTYTAAVREEWGRGDSPSDAARGAITDMYLVIGKQGPDASEGPVTGEFLSALTVLTSERNTRVLDAEPRIPALLWGGLLFGAVLLVGMLAFTGLRSHRGHLLLSSAVSVLLGLLLFIVFWLDHPFGHEMGVTPAPFDRAIEVFDSVDRGA